MSKMKKATLGPVRANQKSNVGSQSSRKQKRQQPHSTTDSKLFPLETCRWTDSGSSVGSSTVSPDFDERSKAFTVPSGDQEESVLAKYVDRFRYGQPQSREHRQQVSSVQNEEQEPSWWMDHPSASCLTPVKTSHKDGLNSIYNPPGSHPKDTSFTAFSDSPRCELNDTDMLYLQEKAAKLFLGDDFCMGDKSTPISSDGLECSNFPPPVDVQQLPIPTLIKPVPLRKTLVPSWTPPTRPEEDILFQWRLRRKMEQARQQPLSLQCPSLYASALGWQPPSAPGQPNTFGSMNKEPIITQAGHFSQNEDHLHPGSVQSEVQRQLNPASSSSFVPDNVLPTSLVSQPHAVSTVPAHMHLLCDVLPCPNKETSLEEKKIVSQRFEEPETKSSHQSVQVPERPFNHANQLKSCGAKQGEEPSLQKVPEKPKKKKAEKIESEKRRIEASRASKKLHKSARRSSKETTQEDTRCIKEQLRQEDRLELQHETGLADQEAPLSPVHAALGQVVSEILFSAKDSTPRTFSPTASESDSAATKEPVSASREDAPPTQVQYSLQVISQLIQEAEDSDEKEFEDDPLLQVLRQQRKWVKDQIGEVDSLLNECLAEQQVT